MSFSESYREPRCSPTSIIFIFQSLKKDRGDVVKKQKRTYSDIYSISAQTSIFIFNKEISPNSEAVRHRKCQALVKKYTTSTYA